jgi:riboflavin kinase/FMN adenylyltransferase
MQIHHGIQSVSQLPKRAAVSIGNFDGIHLGHRKILNYGADLVRDGKASTMVVMTFEPHPLTVLRPQLAPPRLTTPTEKEKLLESAGVDHLVILPPTPDVLNLSAEEFWRILRDDMGIAHIVEGGMFRFGKGAAGTIAKLRQWSAGTSVNLHVLDSVSVPLLDLQMVSVSSSVVRLLISFGRVRDAAICLGRPYKIGGIVQKGFARGRELGFPTANLKCDQMLIPADAVYAGRCTVAGKIYPAAISIGTMPTFGENLRQIEAYLVGFSGDLYGQQLEIELIDWLRDQWKYAGIESLILQLHRDVERTVELAASDPSRAIAMALA